MGPEITLKSIVIMPGGTVRLTFFNESTEEHGAMFISMGTFFGMIGEAAKDYQKIIEMFQQVNQLKAHINGEIDLIDDDGISRLDNEKAKKEIEGLKDEFDYELVLHHIMGY